MPAPPSLRGRRASHSKPRAATAASGIATAGRYAPTIASGIPARRTAATTQIAARVAQSSHAGSLGSKARGIVSGRASAAPCDRLTYTPPFGGAQFEGSFPLAGEAHMETGTYVRGDLAILEAGFAALEQAVLVHDKEGRIVACNPAAARLANRPDDEILGRSARDYEEDVRYKDGTPITGENSRLRRYIRTGKPERNVL